MRFDEGYKEDVTLADGTAVRLRRVRPADKRLLLEGFERLSPESRYRRFFTERNSLGPADLRYLTEVDGVRHFAMGALCRDHEGRQLGIGVTRYVSLDGVVAEPAVAVVDEMQGKGLGRILFQRLVEAAIERGLQRFSAEVLATNDPMRAILGEVSQEYGTVNDAGLLVIDAPLDALAKGLGAHTNPIYQIIRYAAQGLVVMRRALSHAVRDEDEAEDEAPARGERELPRAGVLKGRVERDAGARGEREEGARGPGDRERT